MFRFTFQNLFRRPLRTVLTICGLGGAISVLICLSAFGSGYKRNLQREIQGMGIQLMLVPLGCPYDAAARVLKGKEIELSLPEEALRTVREDPNVAVAAPMLIAALPRPQEGRTDMFAGIDKSALSLKPWWKIQTGSSWFESSNSVIFGATAAEIELRNPGDKFFSPETGRSLIVSSVLERSGTSDDSLFFVPLTTAQEMFHQPSRLTAVAIRLKDPTRVKGVIERLQAIPGAQVVTLTEMMGTFLNLLGSVKTLLSAIAIVALAVTFLTLFNTLLASVLERTHELSILRALGATSFQIFGLLSLESLCITALGGGMGLILALGEIPLFERASAHFLSFAPENSIAHLGIESLIHSGVLAVAGAAAASVYPAWRASRAQPADALKCD
jgi:putative ABC transport system permease protein